MSAIQPGHGRQLHRLGLLGGTFDPVHNGHLALAVQVATTSNLDAVWFVPAQRSPLKAHRPTGNRHRLAMLDLALQDRHRFAVSRVDLDRPAPSYTTDTVAAVRAQVGAGPALFLIAGADMLLDLPDWRDPDRLLSLCRVLVCVAAGLPTGSTDQPDCGPPGRAVADDRPAHHDAGCLLDAGPRPDRRRPFDPRAGAAGRRSVHPQASLVRSPHRRAPAAAGSRREGAILASRW